MHFPIILPLFWIFLLIAGSFGFAHIDSLQYSWNSSNAIHKAFYKGFTFLPIGSLHRIYLLNLLHLNTISRIVSQQHAIPAPVPFAFAPPSNGCSAALKPAPTPPNHRRRWVTAIQAQTDALQLQQAPSQIIPAPPILPVDHVPIPAIVPIPMDEDALPLPHMYS
ncbi:hypothetical protein BU17DRAFT_90023 [Hysterangium stoloniferum]|nr:hypothetical protein BU17DRAFT_90023 [Hysterangium stoloniferum]